ncbi:MAG TPA: LTA synthase family protein [Nitrospiraceae bacterium]|nr:LTA synthase family protein [Nitrospiraceae bacterium]
MNQQSDRGSVGDGRTGWSVARVAVFWWGLLTVVQQAHRLLLLPPTLRVEPADSGLLLDTLITGFRADLTVSSLAVLVAGVAAVGLWLTPYLAARMTARQPPYRLLVRMLGGTLAVLTCCILLFLLVDMGYYTYNRQHPDLIFFEYLDDLFSSSSIDHAAQPAATSSQAGTQTEAEAGDLAKWIPKVLAFLALQLGVFLCWRGLFKRAIAPYLAHREIQQRASTVTGAFAAVLLGFSGFHPMGPWSIARADIPSTAYYLLAQNPLWYTGDVWYGSYTTKLGNAANRLAALMAIPEAIDVTRATIGSGARFLSEDYPLVRRSRPSQARTLRRPPNVMLLFIEGLDRRFLGRAVRPSPARGLRPPTDSDVTELYRDGLDRLLPAGMPETIRLTPFLDRLGADSVYFENFFSPGDKTHHGIFSSLCSFYSGYGRSPIKSRYTYEYLCLPSLLLRAGYETEMVLGYNRDYHQDHTALFVGRNGVKRFFDESRFPADAERRGLGVTDGALFDFMAQRVRAMKAGARPYFLTTLTLNTHHPYDAPLRHPEVAALRNDPDPYLATLRYVDAELERFFSTLTAEGLLDNTVVLILGDHGRHERIGRGSAAQFVGHHTIPLFVWLDPSLRAEAGYRPRVVSTVASQVDIAPTVLGLAGLTPKEAGFVGQDLSCLLWSECAPQSVALLCGIQQIGLAQSDGLLLYSIVRDLVQTVPLDLRDPARDRRADDAEIAERLRTSKALLVTAHVLLEKNRIWSWKLFEKEL